MNASNPAPLSARTSAPSLAWTPLVLVAGLFVVLELGPVLNDAYGYFIDEFYYFSCASRPALGYVDHPPLAAWLLALARPIVGDSLVALRLMPALAGGACVLLAGVMAWQLGAGRRGQSLAALAMLVCPGTFAIFGFYSMNAFEVLLWTASSVVFLHIASSENRKAWLWFGLLAGIGMLNKHTYATFGAAVFVGLLLSRSRRDLLTPWPWIAAALALVIFVPNLVWQFENDWASLEFYRNASEQKNVPAPPLKILMDQLMIANVGAVLIWSAGLLALLFSPVLRAFRAMGWAYVVLLVLLIVSEQSRPDRIYGIYPVLFAAGAAWWDRLGKRWVMVTLGTAAAALGLAVSVSLVPLLAPPQLATYAATLGTADQAEAGPGKVSPIPQLLADRRGWDEYVAQVVEAVNRLAPEELATAAILTPSYGHAGALELLGPEDLPTILCGQNNWYLWGPPEHAIDTLIAVGYGPDSLGDYFEFIELVDRTSCTYCMAWRNDMPIYIATGAKAPLAASWAKFKHFE